MYFRFELFEIARLVNSNGENVTSMIYIWNKSTVSFVDFHALSLQVQQYSLGFVANAGAAHPSASACAGRWVLGARCCRRGAVLRASGRVGATGGGACSSFAGVAVAVRLSKADEEHLSKVSLEREHNSGWRASQWPHRYHKY